MTGGVFCWATSAGLDNAVACSASGHLSPVSVICLYRDAADVDS